MNTKIKICGIRDEAEAVFLNNAHVDYAGMVMFYEKSRRNVTRTRRIRHARTDRRTHPSGGCGAQAGPPLRSGGTGGAALRTEAQVSQ